MSTTTGSQRAEAGALVGKKVRLVREVHRLTVRLPAGRTGTVEGYVIVSSRPSFRLLMDPCECCGVAPALNALRREDFEPLE